MDEFHKTRMGQQFYERTMPALVEQLKRLNDLLEQIGKKLDETDPGEEPSCRT